MRTRKAFTLVELLVVIAIIAVLLAILLPSLASVKEMAKRIKCGNNLRGTGMGIKLYADNNSGSLPPIEMMVRKTPPKPQQSHAYWVASAESAGSGAGQPPKYVFNLGSLHKAGLIDNPVVFYCPADNLWQDIYKCYNTPGPWGAKITDYSFPDPRLSGQSDTYANRVTYAYWPQGRKYMTAGNINDYQDGFSQCEIGIPVFALDVASLNSGKAMVSDNGGHSLGGTAVESGVNKGVNALFGDGHVKFQPPPRVVEGNGHSSALVGLPMSCRQEDNSLMGGGTGTTDQNRTGVFFNLLVP
jgi:prepilin-type N-terminal cleavage/methylation domain-containing protein/prepilin-type processing-associated H-X9-DG protein